MEIFGLGYSLEPRNSTSFKNGVPQTLRAWCELNAEKFGARMTNEGDDWTRWSLNGSEFIVDDENFADNIEPMAKCLPFAIMRLLVAYRQHARRWKLGEPILSH